MSQITKIDLWKSLESPQNQQILSNVSIKFNESYAQYRAQQEAGKWSHWDEVSNRAKMSIKFLCHP